MAQEKALAFYQTLSFALNVAGVLHIIIVAAPHTTFVSPLTALQLATRHVQLRGDFVTECDG